MDLDTLAVKVRAGEPEAVLKLWEGVRHFVWKKAWEWARNSGGRLQADDLAQCGFIATLETANKFDPEAGYHFFSALSYSLSKAFQKESGTYTSKRDASFSAISIDLPLCPSDADSGSTILDAIKDESGEVPFENVEYLCFLDHCRKIIYNALGTLSDLQASVIQCHYLQGKTLKETAKLCELSSKQAACEAENRALYNLKHGKYYRELQECLEVFNELDQYASAAKFTGIGRYRKTGISSTEAAGILRTGGIRNEL